jgi:hypothetical protein
MIYATIKNLDGFLAELDSEYKQFIKTAFTVVKVEGFNQMRQLQSEIKAGSPGGQPFKPLTWLARVMRDRKYGGGIRFNIDRHPSLGKTENWPPLYRTFHGVRYHVTFPGQTSMNFQFGFGTIFSSSSWKRIARMQQEGFTTPVTNKMRMDFVMKAGIPLSSSTTQLVTPARDIITPFWEKHQSQMWENIKTSFELKSKGTWI